MSPKAANSTRHVIWRVALLCLIALAVVAFVTTIYTMRGGLSPTNDLSFISRILWIDLAILCCIAILVLGRLASSWFGMGKKGGSSLLARVTMLFSAVAIVPTVLIIIFSVTAFNLGVQTWFSTPVSTAINEAEAVAEQYLKEHKQTLVIRALEMASDLNRDQATLIKDRFAFNQAMDSYAFDYELNEAVVLNTLNFKLAFGGMSPLASAFAPKVSQDEFKKADTGEVILIDSGDQRSVDAMLRLQDFDEAYLYITKFVDPQVVERVRRTGDAAATYTFLDEGKEQFQDTFLLIFANIGMLLLLSALGFGMLFANNLTGPIAKLTSAADLLGEGDLNARVEVPESRTDEISTLSKTFNRMATRLDTQQTDLREANIQLDERRKFTEAVLTGVSAGVIGLDGDCTINLPNEAASGLLNRELDGFIGKNLEDVAPEFSELAEKALADLATNPNQAKQVVFEEVAVMVKGEKRTFRLVFVRERGKDKDTGFILTFDDITDLQQAERKAAWSDVARRIAHEIKNPLTPIQLSAERLKRRYSKQIEDGRETFDLCTDTIIRQVADIGRMVDEFSNFARTPTPVMSQNDIREICEQAVFLQNNRDTSVEFEAILPNKQIKHTFDPSLISQSVINILKNAGEAVETRREQDSDFKEAGTKGKVRLTLVSENDKGEAIPPRVYIQDNGCGIPEGMKTKLTEPYVTTRTKGTGLGLAIVKKILEDHGGQLLVDEPLPDNLADNTYDGANFALVLG